MRGLRELFWHGEAFGGHWSIIDETMYCTFAVVVSNVIEDKDMYILYLREY